MSCMSSVSLMLRFTSCPAAVLVLVKVMWVPIIGLNWEMVRVGWAATEDVVMAASSSSSISCSPEINQIKLS